MPDALPGMPSEAPRDTKGAPNDISSLSAHVSPRGGGGSAGSGPRRSRRMRDGPRDAFRPGGTRTHGPRHVDCTRARLRRVRVRAVIRRADRYREGPRPSWPSSHHGRAVTMVLTT